MFMKKSLVQSLSVVLLMTMATVGYAADKKKTAEKKTENENVVEYNMDDVRNYIQTNEYKAKRSNEYPSLFDQLDMLWHAINTNSLDKTSDFYTTIKAVKDKYPKS